MRRARWPRCEALRDRLPISAQAVRNGLAMVELPGRFQIVPGQPALVLDVAHNPQAVAALAVTSTQMGFYPAHARGVRRDARQGHRRRCWRMAPLVDAWHFATCPRRAQRRAQRCAHCRPNACAMARAGAPADVHTHASPIDALRQR